VGQGEGVRGLPFPLGRLTAAAAVDDALAAVLEHGVGLVEPVADGAEVVAEATQVLAAGDGVLQEVAA
jgi:hypothetical protein